MGSVWRCLKYVWMAGAAVLAELTAHELLALVLAALAVVLVLAVLARGMLRWIISSAVYSDRMIQMIRALRGDGGSLTQEHSALSSPQSPAPSPTKRQKLWRRKLRRGHR
jgi:hypothetical protein